MAVLGLTQHGGYHQAYTWCITRSPEIFQCRRCHRLYIYKKTAYLNLDLSNDQRRSKNADTKIEQHT